MFHLQHRFDIAEEQFDLPPATIESGDLVGGVFFRIQQCRDQSQLPGAKSFCCKGNADHPQRQFLGQGVPEPLTDCASASDWLLETNEPVPAPQPQSMAKVRAPTVVEARYAIDTIDPQASQSSVISKASISDQHISRFEVMPQLA